jgi:glycosyltransferase involved in cell wall biosynthesis
MTHVQLSASLRPGTSGEGAGGSRADGIVLAHDYATQRGGAERVALKLAEAFPGAPMFTTLYEPSDTFAEFGEVDIRPGRLNRYDLLRQHHRLALPLLARAVDAQPVTGSVLFASSTGWAHGYQGADHTVVYCHAPARWLYQTDRYLGSHRNPGMRGLVRQTAARTAVKGLMSRLREWDLRNARRADLYLANSTVTQRAIAEVYGIEAEVLPPPPALTPGGPERDVEGVEPGYLLCVARLLPYKNVDAVIEAVNAVPGARLVVVGSGPDRERLQRLAGPGVQLLGSVEDDQLRWLYRNAAALVAASYEDYGLSPLEAGSFGRPSIVLRAGGFLDTVVEGRNGLFFDQPTPAAISSAIRDANQCTWDERVIIDHVDAFSARRFVRRLQAIADRFTGAVTVPAQRKSPFPVRADALVA